MHSPACSEGQRAQGEARASSSWAGSRFRGSVGDEEDFAVVLHLLLQDLKAAGTLSRGVALEQGCPVVSKRGEQIHARGDVSDERSQALEKAQGNVTPTNLRSRAAKGTGGEASRDGRRRGLR